MILEEIDDDMDISEDELDEKKKEDLRKQSISDEFIKRAISLLGMDLSKNIEKDVLRVSLTVFLF